MRQQRTEFFRPDGTPKLWIDLELADETGVRTSNGLERLNKEIKRRTRVATLFPNEASVLRLVSAVLSEISDDWETERSCLNMKAR